jgi:predicted phosphate transport protein (TIGR00153 family)
MLFPHKKDHSFYDLLDAQAQSAHDAAATFNALVLDFPQIRKYLKKLEDIEHEADQLTYSFVNKVNTQFITPMDKEDMHALTDRLDDITDTIEKAANRIEVYKLKAPRAELAGLVAMLVGITNEIQALVGLLRKGLKEEELSPVISGIHAMESRMDKAFRKALTALFEDNDLDPRQLIQWKEIYELIEKAINRCEKLAGFVESLMVKYA